MLKNILSISGRPGLFRLVNRGKNMLIVESIANGKRTPAYAHDKVISLADISIYTEDGEDTLLGNVLEAVKTKTDGKPVDVKALGGDKEIRSTSARSSPSSIARGYIPPTSRNSSLGITSCFRPASPTSHPRPRRPRRLQRRKPSNHTRPLTRF